MDVEEVEKQQEKMNDENDAREEDIVKDTDADTRDTDDSINRVMKKLDSLFDEIDSLKGGIKALQNAQAMLVENGAVIDDRDNGVSEDNSERKSVSFDDIDFSL